MGKQNVLLGGLWFGYSKPNMRVFLRPIIKVLSGFELHGILVKVWGMTTAIVSKVIVLAGTCDLPAKSLIGSLMDLMVVKDAYKRVKLLN